MATRNSWKPTTFGFARIAGDWIAIVRRTETGWEGGVMLVSMMGKAPMPSGVRAPKRTALKVLLGIELNRLNAGKA